MAAGYRFGEFVLDSEAGELRHRGVRLSLEPKAFGVLLHLVRHRHRIVSIPELLTAVWADVAVERGSAHRAIRLLRGIDGVDLESVVIRLTMMARDLLRRC